MNWVGLLTEALWERHGDGLVTMINVSECGLNFLGLLAQLERKVLRWQPDLVILKLWLAGLRDADASVETAAQQAFRDVVTRIRAARPGDVDILVCTPNPRVLCHGHEMPAGAQPGEVHEHPHWNSRRNAQLVALAKANGCAVVDHFTAWQRKTYAFAHPGSNPRGLWQRMIDPVHPNAVGHLAMFRELAATFDVAPQFLWEEAPPAR
jgi:lysophospholipase L1-like esterase